MQLQIIESGFPEEVPVPLGLADLCEWVEQNGYPISGYFRLDADDGKTMSRWFGFDDVSHHLGLFGSGPDGSLYAVWNDGTGRYPIVHMGSEGQNNMVLASTFVDFLRLLAIGYGEIGFEELSQPPQEQGPNRKFQRWVEEKFATSVPAVGTEIALGAQKQHPEFQAWIDKALSQFG